MPSTLIVGGTGFVGRHTVEEVLDHGYDVTVLGRGNRGRPPDAGGERRDADGDPPGGRGDPPDGRGTVAYLEGDRTDEGTLEAVARQVDPDDDTVGGSVSWAAELPGIQDHHDYWIDRVARYDRVVVPGDGTAIWHRAYVEDVARAIRVVAEEGRPGRAYNAGDRRVLTMEDVIDLIADTLGTSVEVVHASRRELDLVGLEPDDFVLYHHLGSNYPHVLSTCRLSALGWRSTPPEVAMERTVEESLASDRDGSAFDPGRETEQRLIGTLRG